MRSLADLYPKVDQLEWQLRRNNGLKFCSAYLNYYPATKTQWVTKTKTQRGYYEAVPITRTSTRMVTETSTETVETTATVYVVVANPVEEEGEAY